MDMNDDRLQFGEDGAPKMNDSYFENLYDDLPKEIIRLIPVMTLYQATGNHPAFSSEDICKTIANELIDQLTNGFKKIKNPSTGRISPAGEWFAVSYQGEVYQIEAKTFELTPIKNNDAVKI